jgi:hypothetical protein
MCVILALAAPAQGVILSALHGPGTPGYPDPLPNPPWTDPQPMPPGVTTNLYQPGAGPTPEWNVYGNVAAETLIAAGFTTEYGNPVAELVSPFQTIVGDENLTGTIRSEVYRHGTDAHLLFVYTITNDPNSTQGVAFANLVDWDNIKIIDAGEIALEAGIQNFYTYSRLDTGPGNLRFTFRTDTGEGALLEPGDESTHGYAETDAPVIARGYATVQDEGLSQDAIPVLVPTYIPEPLTMVGLLMGLGGIGAHIRRRRMA